MQFLKETARKRVREKDNEKMPEKSAGKPEFQAEKPEFWPEKPEKHPIHSTNQQSETIVGFSYGGKHESNKRNKDPPWWDGTDQIKRID